MFQHTVIEVAYLKASVCVMDLFVNNILTQDMCSDGGEYLRPIMSGKTEMDRLTLHQ